ncbi:MAG: hypothetical protein FJ008_07475 [Chloroflexi bacterium]|nr:hypothetical protein [Chloroflexota bacterium]MBM3175720.1 hypothetical protein [Chloroflexota bacterium]MBM4450470.1 hypothetical protein [Chloroflexota bacterium]
MYGGIPPEVTTGGPCTSPKAGEIITADLELPSDFSGQDFSLRRLYVSNDAITGPQTGVYRLDNLVIYGITPPITPLSAGAPRPNGVSSIAYYGTYAAGALLAGEVATDPAKGMVNIQRTSNPTASTPTWQRSDNFKSPTGGGVSWFANAQVAWSFDGARAYCGTSAANPTIGGTNWALNQWPRAWLNTVPLDESAFSISPYSRTYEQDLLLAEKTLDTDVGTIWNQVGIIDTETSFLSDVAALDVPEDSTDYPVRYLASINNNAPVAQNFDSVWRRTGDNNLLQTWERILCIATASDDAIVRVNPRKTEDKRSQALVFAGTLSTDIRYSPDEGQTWQYLSPNITVTDLTLASETSMYILSDTDVRRGKITGTNWAWDAQKDTLLNSGHTIATPLENPGKKTGGEGEHEDWVAVGSADGYVTYADFSAVNVQFLPPPAQRIPTPAAGNTHVVFDEKFHENSIIYAASNDTAAGTSGKMYRWTVGKSTAWDELEPPNNAFYGICQARDVLYGVWNIATPPETPPGVDRTLYPRSAIPPPIEWDDLTTGLPTPPSVFFTREPTALKISTNDYNNLWAIDDRNYDFANKLGCLWAYTDTMTRKGPWATAPPSGDLIPVDPVSGRADEVNFAWDSLESATGYELEIAKDKDFTIRILSSDNITPVDQTAPAVYFPAGGLSPTPASAIGNWGNLEAGHDYYWRVRASRAATGEIIHSPWSATMYFTVKIGVPTTAEHLGLKLLKPSTGCRDVSLTPSFSWAPFPKTTAYEFVLARDPALSNYIVKTTISGTAYEYKEDILDTGTVYYWQVRAIKPVPSDPSPVSTFTTITADEEPQPSIPKKTSPPFWIWIVIGIYAVLIVALIVFASMKPAYFGPTVKRDSEPQPFTGKSTNPFTRIIKAVSLRMRRSRYLDKPQSREAMEPEPDAQFQQAIKPRHIVEKPANPFSEKMRALFNRIAEATSPRIRERHYLDELEEKGIIKPEAAPIEELPRESLLSRLRHNILSRFRKRQHPEDEENFQ